MRRAAWAGIDAPFGWPDALVDAVGIYAQYGTWPADVSVEALRYRETDRFVRAQVKRARGVSINPLSVSSNCIASTAWAWIGSPRRSHEVYATIADYLGA